MNNKRKNGFTLIELIVVIAILAVLGMLLVPQISGYIDASQSATCANNRKLIERSIALSEANDVDPTTLTTLDAIKAANGSIYKGGEVCPKNGNISINNRKVTCELHKDDGSGGGTPGFIYTGTIMDQSDNPIILGSGDSTISGQVYVSKDDKGNTYYYKCLAPAGSTCSTIVPTKNIDSSIANHWKQITLEYSGLNNYENGDIIRFNNKYYKFTGKGTEYYGKVPTNKDSGFEEVTLSN